MIKKWQNIYVVFSFFSPVGVLETDKRRQTFSKQQLPDLHLTLSQILVSLFVPEGSNLLLMFVSVIATELWMFGVKVLGVKRPRQLHTHS